MLALVGVGNALVDVGVFTLFARLVDDAVLGRPGRRRMQLSLLQRVPMIASSRRRRSSNSRPASRGASYPRQAEVVRDGRCVHMLEPGDCFGEIALIRKCRRTAAVKAGTPLTVRGLNGTAFVAAMTGYSRSTQAVEKVIAERLPHGHEADPSRVVSR